MSTFNILSVIEIQVRSPFNSKAPSINSTWVVMLLESRTTHEIISIPD